MAAEIHSRPQSSRPVLLSKVEGHQDVVSAALLIPKEDGVITASEDRTIRVWLKRDSGQYWPSIYHTMSSPCSAMAYHHDSRRIFVGQDNGAIMVSCCDFSSECGLELLRLSVSTRCFWQLIICFLSLLFGMQLPLNG
uniref:WD repeat and FYVE domain-containing protein 2 n=1 Tax=Accipiter nisus TaxID=211598 RepID=A0A8B9MVB8_9AVES